jgi:hypothetical protein
MSWLIGSVWGAMSSLFEGSAGSEERKEKEAQKRGRAGDAGGGRSEDGDARVLGRRARRRRTQQELQDESEKLRLLLTPKERDTIIVAMYDRPKLSATKKYLTESERQELLDDVNRATGESIPSFDALRKRVERIRDRGTLSRKPGSGRKRKVTEEHVEAANSVARAFGGNISRQKIFETVREHMGPEKAVGRTQLYEMMGTRLKARRTRYKPSLTSSQKQLRVAYAQQQVSSAFEEEERTVFADEKRFEAHSPGILNIPVEDLTPKHFAQSKGNSPFVMVLVVVVAPRGDWNGVVAAVPFMERVDAARASKNREAGTIEYKSLNVTRR